MGLLFSPTVEIFFKRTRDLAVVDPVKKLVSLMDNPGDGQKASEF